MKKLLLEDCCEILDSMRIPITASERKSGSYPYYGANGIQDYVADYIFDDELVLLAEDGGNFGSKTKPIAYRVSGKCWVNNHAHVLKPKKDFNVDYLCYSLMFYNTDGLINGATRQKLTQATMRQMLIPQRAYQEQCDIVAQMNKVNLIIKTRQNQLQKLDELVKARFVELFGDPISNPMNWNKRTLKEVCTKLNDGTHFSPESFSMGDYKYITAKNIKASGFDFSNITYVPEAVHRPIFERCNPEQGDVLYIKDGATTGIAIVNTLKEEFTLLSSVALLKQNRNVINGYFLAALLNNADMYSDIRNNMGGAAITRLTIAKLNAVKVIVPPLDLQNRFAAFVEQVDKSKVAVQKSLGEAQHLFDCLCRNIFPKAGCWFTS